VTRPAWGCVTHEHHLRTLCEGGLQTTVRTPIKPSSHRSDRQRFDADIPIGEFVDQDLVVVKITPDIHWSVIGNAAYIAAHGRPIKPEDGMTSGYTKISRPLLGEHFLQRGEHC
jgi:hypothetical protein